MKKHLTSLLLLLSMPVILIAQVPVVTTGNFFQVNAAYPYKTKFTDPTLTDALKVSGANVVWNFSGIDLRNSVFSFDTTESVEAEFTPMFPFCGISGADSANLCLVNKSDHFHMTDDYHYYSVKNGKVAEFGSDQDNGVVEDVAYQYEPARTMFILPLSYSDQTANPFRGSYLSYLSGVHYMWGTDSLLADGYGTLIIDQATFENCVRLKRISHVTDSNDTRGVYSYRSVTYTWFSTLTEGPILVMSKESENSQDLVWTSYYYKLASAVDGHKELRSVDIYPVPSQNEVFVRFSDQPVAGTDWLLYNIAGQLVMHEKLEQATTRIDISLLPKGIYSYQVLGKNGNYKPGRIIKQ